MGSLRGIVHAGYNGNKEAIVAALNLYPTQLRIADVITRSPDDKQAESQFIPEMAYIKDNFVYIDRYLPSKG
jgi:septum site-determining protein MinC